jgi:hypothetical protein
LKVQVAVLFERGAEDGVVGDQAAGHVSVEALGTEEVDFRGDRPLGSIW